MTEVATYPTWEIPCVSCGEGTGRTAREGYYSGDPLCKSCRRAGQVRALEVSGVPVAFRTGEKGLDTFTRRKPSDELAWTAAWLCVNRGRSFVLTGPTGCGKSHLAAGVIREVVLKGKRARFITFTNLMMKIRDQYSDGKVADIVDDYAEMSCLAIDDLGVERQSADAAENLYRIVNARLEERLPTVFTSNYDLPALTDRYSQNDDSTPSMRLLRRIADMVGEDGWIQMEG